MLISAQHIQQLRMSSIMETASPSIPETYALLRDIQMEILGMSVM